jgi:hypothetical protein
VLRRRHCVRSFWDPCLTCAPVCCTRWCSLYSTCSVLPHRSHPLPSFRGPSVVARAAAKLHSSVVTHEDLRGEGASLWQGPRRTPRPLRIRRREFQNLAGAAPATRCCGPLVVSYYRHRRGEAPHAGVCGRWHCTRDVLRMFSLASVELLLHGVNKCCLLHNGTPFPCSHSAASCTVA